MSPPRSDTVLLAEVDRPRGIAGEVVARLHADDPSRLDEVGEVTIVTPKGARAARIEGWKHRGDRVVLKLSGVDTPEAAEELRGAEIRIPRSASAARAPEGRWFAWQIEGLEVLDPKGNALGTVARVLQPSGGQALLEVRGPRGEFLVPLVAAICKEIDVKSGRIVIDPPEGLIDLNAV